MLINVKVNDSVKFNRINCSTVKKPIVNKPPIKKFSFNEIKFNKKLIPNNEKKLNLKVEIMFILFVIIKL